MQTKKKIYKNPEWEIVLFDTADVITGSMSGNIDDDGIDVGIDSWDEILGSW